MKRFYEIASAEPADGGFQISLDGRPVCTPMKAFLIVRQKSLADAVAQEWGDQNDEIDIDAMPLNALLNVAIDHVELRSAEVIAELAAYVESDLLCYRDDKQDELCRTQDQKWQPVLDWAVDSLSIALSVTLGVLPVPQPSEASEAAREILDRMEPLTLAAMLKLVPALGSFLLGLAVIYGHLGAEEAYEISILEETWQEQKWGRDEEAIQRRAGVRTEMAAVGRLLELAGLIGRI